METRGAGVTDGTRVTLTCEDGLQLEIAGARLLDTKTSKEIQPAKWDTQSCDTADLAVLDPRRL